MQARPTTIDRRMVGLATGMLAVVLAGGALLVPAQAQLSDPATGAGDTLDETVDTGQGAIDDTTGDVGGPVGDTVDQVQQAIDDVQGTVGEIVDDPKTALPTVPTLPTLPALPGAGASATGTDKGSGGAVADGVTAASADSKGRADTPRRASATRQDAPERARTTAVRGRSLRVLSSADIIALLEEAGAPAATVQRVLAPFPVAGTAQYTDDGTAPAMVDIEVLDDRAPVVSVAAGTVTSAVQGRSGESDMVVSGDDGIAYTYRGVDAAASAPRVGERVDRADVLGTADGTLGFGQGPATPAFLEDALGHARAKAGLYATAMSVARALFGGLEVDAVPAASVVPVPLPRSLVLGAAALLVAVSLGLVGAAPASAPPARFRRRRPVVAPAQE